MFAFMDRCVDAVALRGPGRWMTRTLGDDLLGMGGDPRRLVRDSFYPYVAPEQLTLWEAAASPESLLIIFIGACAVLPVIIGYSAFAYWVFRGKATALRYD